MYETTRNAISLSSENAVFPIVSSLALQQNQATWFQQYVHMLVYLAVVEMHNCGGPQTY